MQAHQLAATHKEHRLRTRGVVGFAQSLQRFTDQLVHPEPHAQRSPAPEDLVSGVAREDFGDSVALQARVRCAGLLPSLLTCPCQDVVPGVLVMFALLRQAHDPFNVVTQVEHELVPDEPVGLTPVRAAAVLHVLAVYV